MRALSIRQPYAELILRGVKTIEYRSRPTRIIGERFYIYASKGKALPQGTGHQALVKALGPAAAPLVPSASCLVPAASELPTGVIVGSAVVTHCTPNGNPGMYEWHLAKVRRFARRRMRKPTRQPQPVWFRPF